MDGSLLCKCQHISLIRNIRSYLLPHSYSLKVYEFTALSISELVSRYTWVSAQQCVHYNGWSGLKHVGTDGYHFLDAMD